MKLSKLNKSKKAKFFCESCGSEVSKNAKVCNYCGKFFSSVRCPKCGNTGHSDEFIHGCPNCGYAVHNNNIRGGNNGGSAFLSRVMGLYNYSSDNKTKNDSANSDGSLPFWIYIVAVLCLIGVIFGVYSCLN